MSEKASETLERDKFKLRVMPIQNSINPSPIYRRPAIAILEALRPSQVQALLKINKENKAYVQDLKLFHRFSAIPQARISETVFDERTPEMISLDKRVMNVIQITSNTIPPEILASQYSVAPELQEKLLNAVFGNEENKESRSKNAPKPTLSPSPSPSPSGSSGESEEEIKKRKKNEPTFSGPTPFSNL